MYLFSLDSNRIAVGLWLSPAAQSKLAFLLKPYAKTYCVPYFAAVHGGDSPKPCGSSANNSTEDILL